jgi:transposase-like protein
VTIDPPFQRRLRVCGTFPFPRKPWKNRCPAWFWCKLLKGRWDSWRVDETYIKVRGQWVYLYRAVDKEGCTVDFLLSRRRDMAAAKRFFSKATKQHGAPRVITLDGYAASHRAVAKLKTSGILPAPRTGAILQVFEQRGRARSSPDKRIFFFVCHATDCLRRP